LPAIGKATELIFVIAQGCRSFVDARPEKKGPSLPLKRSAVCAFFASAAPLLAVLSLAATGNLSVRGLVDSAAPDTVWGVAESTTLV
jgi:hypothetical protein